MEIPEPINKTARQIRPHLHRNLRIRLGIYLAVSFVVAGFVIYNAVTTGHFGIFAIVGVGLGLLVGYFASRIHKIRWDDTAEKAIAKVDAFGGVILVLYILFEVFRSKIVGNFVEEANVTVTSFSILAGIMYGRVLGIRGNVVKVLKEQDIIE